MQDKNMLFWCKMFLVTSVLLALSFLAERIGFPIQHMFSIVFTSIVLSAAMTPLARLFQRVHIPRGITVLITYIAFLALLSAVGAMIVPLIAQQGHALAVDLPTKLPVYWTSIHDLVQKVSPSMAEEMNTGFKELVPQISHQLSTFADTLSGVLGRLISLSVDSLLVLVIAFFLTIEEGSIHSMVKRFTPLEDRAAMTATVDRIIYEMGSWARAQLLLALFFGVTFGTVLYLLGVPYAITIGFVGAVLDIIPYVGGAVALGLALLIELQQGWLWGLIVFGVYFVILEIEWHVLAPPLMDRYLHLKNVVIVIALAIGAVIMGILGALLALPMAIVLRAILDYASPYQADAEDNAHAGKVSPVRPVRKSRWRPWRHWVHAKVQARREGDQAPVEPIEPGQDGDKHQD